MHPVNIDNGRFRKFGKKYREGVHTGHDYDCPEGTEIYCPCDGRVIYLDQMNGFGGMYPSKKGLVLMIEHFIKNVRYVSLFGHISDVKVRVHEKVQKREIIAMVGSFYNCKDYLPHLHYVVYKCAKGIPAGPYGYVASITDQIDPIKFSKKLLKRSK